MHINMHNAKATVAQNNAWWPRPGRPRRHICIKILWARTGNTKDASARNWGACLKDSPGIVGVVHGLEHVYAVTIVKNNKPSLGR